MQAATVAESRAVQAGGCETTAAQAAMEMRHLASRLVRHTCMMSRFLVHTAAARP